MSDIKLDNEVKQIIKIYRLISFWFMRFWVFIFVLILGILLLYILSKNQDSVFSFEDIDVGETNFYIEQPWELVWEKIIYFGNKTFTWLNVELLFWNIFLNTKNTVISNNNIIHFWDYYLPNYFELTQSQKKLFMNYFSWDIKWEVDINRLNDYLKIIKINTENKNIQSIKPPSKLKSLNWNFLEKFWLKCMIKGFWNSQFCSSNIEYFLNNFYNYQITEDITSLEIINQVIQWTKYKKEYCDWLLYFMYKTSDINLELWSYLIQCWSDYESIYRKLVWFKEVVWDLWKWRISSKIYQDNSINMYKLISCMSFIVNLNAWVDIDDINWFLEFVTDILIEKKIKNDVYYDLLYIFINHSSYLPNSIKLAPWKSDDTALVEVKKKISNININLWLETLVTNKKIIQQLEKKQKVNNVNTNTVKERFNSYISEFKNFRNYWDVMENDIDREVTIWESSITLNISKWSWKKEEIDIMINKITFKLDLNNRFFIKDVRFVSEELTNQVIWYIKNREGITFPELLEQVEYFWTIDWEVKFDFCKVLNEHLKWVTLDDEKVEILLCDPKKVVVLKFDGVLYRFFIKNNSFDYFSINDKDLFEKLKQNNDKTILIEQMPQFIYDIVSYRIEVETMDIDLSDARTIISKIDMYLWAEVLNSEQLNWEEWLYKVKFELDSNIFVWELDFKNNYSLYNIFYQIEDRDKVVEISLWGIMFRLTESDMSKLNFFSDRPMEYIERNEPNSYKKIVDYLENNK